MKPQDLQVAQTFNGERVLPKEREKKRPGHIETATRSGRESADHPAQKVERR